MVTTWLVPSRLSLSVSPLEGAPDARVTRRRLGTSQGDNIKVVIEKWKKKERDYWKKLNKNKLGTLNIFRDLVWQKSEDENILIISKLPFLKSTDIEINTALQKCFQIIKISKRYWHS